MRELGLLAQASGIALLLGALLGTYAAGLSEEPKRSNLLRQARWLVLPGYVGVGIWAVILAIGLLIGGCDPLFGGWVRSPRAAGAPASELPGCSDALVEARVRPALAAENPRVPADWSRVYRRYDDAMGVLPKPGWVWVETPRSGVIHVAADKLEFRDVPRRWLAWLR